MIILCVRMRTKTQVYNMCCIQTTYICSKIMDVSSTRNDGLFKASIIACSKSNDFDVAMTEWVSIQNGTMKGDLCPCSRRINIPFFISNILTNAVLSICFKCKAIYFSKEKEQTKKCINCGICIIKNKVGSDLCLTCDKLADCKEHIKACITCSYPYDGREHVDRCEYCRDRNLVNVKMSKRNGDEVKCVRRKCQKCEMLLEEDAPLKHKLCRMCNSRVNRNRSKGGWKSEMRDESNGMKSG